MEIDDPSNATLIDALCTKVLRQETSLESFAHSCTKIWDIWMTILSRTILPPDITTQDPRIATAFIFLENVISQAEGVIQWLAYIQLTQLFTTLRIIIRNEREISRRLLGSSNLRRRGTGEDSIAIDLCENALGGTLKRAQTVERRRIGRRWVSLVKGSPLLSLTFTEEAEIIVNDFKRIHNGNLSLLGDRIAQQCPL
ncbi:hypothetical protein QBC38DRAFT_523004 [Podospora fimiseda]|uniref:Uncharacterized protein n=1 Tax=Podospora fimiseda TaxID=252190 RepID=A0AAN6YLB8_9PEZI|nr:hypothetical protein QBC38DRAFT_523004 [Podospora fimiseda]